MFYTYDYQSQNWLCLKQDVYQPLFIPFLPSSKMGWCSVHKKWEPCIRTDKGKLYFLCGKPIRSQFATIEKWTISSVETEINDLRELVRLKVNLVYTTLEDGSKRYYYEYKIFSFFMKTGAVVSYESSEALKKVNINLPATVTKDLQAKLMLYAKKNFGTGYSNSSPKSGIEALSDYVTCPACPQMSDLRHFLGNAFTRIVDRKSQNPYQAVCNAIHVKPFKRMRRIFDKNPLALPLYAVLKSWGFRDVNVMTKFLEDDELCKTYFRDIEYDWKSKRIVAKDESHTGRLFYALRDEAKDIITIVSRWAAESLMIQNEKITMNHLIKAMKDGYHNFFDAAQMYYSRGVAIPEALRDRIRKECFTQAVHDELVRVFPDTFGLWDDGPKGNVEIPYLQSDKILETEITDVYGRPYKFILPKDTDELYNLGQVMHNCVGYCYKKATIKRNSIIVGLANEQMFIACIQIETDSMSIVQAKGICNSKLSMDIRQLIIKWAYERGIGINTSDIISRGYYR